MGHTQQLQAAGQATTGRASAERRSHVSPTLPPLSWHSRHRAVTAPLALTPHLAQARCCAARARLRDQTAAAQPGSTPGGWQGAIWSMHRMGRCGERKEERSKERKGARKIESDREREREEGGSADCRQWNLVPSGDLRPWLWAGRGAAAGLVSTVRVATAPSTGRLFRHWLDPHEVGSGTHNLVQFHVGALQVMNPSALGRIVSGLAMICIWDRRHNKVERTLFVRAAYRRALTLVSGRPSARQLQQRCHGIGHISWCIERR